MIQDAAAAIGILVIVLPVLAYLFAACYKSFKAFKMVKEISEQFKTNGGSTIVDKITAIGVKLDTLMAMNDVSFNLVAYPMLKADPQGQVTWNRQFAHESGLSELESCGLGWLAFVIEEDRTYVRDIWLDGTRDCRPVVIEFDTIDGRYATIEALPIKSSKGLIGMLGTLKLEGGYCNG